MKKLLLIILATLIILTSCELTTKQNNSQRNVYLISLALNYETSNHSLNYTLNDQEGIFNEIKYLSHDTSSPFNYYLLTEDGTKLTINENGNIAEEAISFSSPSNKIKDLVLSKLSTYSASMDENDILVFHYSGHGIEDGGLVYHIQELDNNNTGHKHNVLTISNDDLVNAIKEYKGVKLLLLDSCYSGVHYNEIANEYNKSSIEYLFKAPQLRRNIFTLTASSSTELAEELSGYGQLSKCFLEALGFNTSTKMPGRRYSKLWFSELVTYVQKYITSLQHPQGNEIKDFILF